MSGPIPTSFGVVGVSTWRNEIGHVLSTVIGKISLELAANGALSLLKPAPLVANDKLTSDVRFVTEVSELMPWAECASMLAYGGPLRFTLESDQGTRTMLTASTQAPAGYGVASGERSRYARESPVRGLDGLTTIPDELDGRYFIAAPRRHQMSSLRGDEVFVFEAGPQPIHGRLPGLAIAATIEVYDALRVLALSWDTLIVEPVAHRISLVGRAGIEGPATLISHAIVPSAQLRSADRGTPRARMASPVSTGPDSIDRWPFGWAGASADPSFDDTSLLGETLGTADIDLGSLRARLAEETADVAKIDLLRQRVPSIPFDRSSEQEANRTISMRQVPATPFDAGFAPTAVVPAADVTATLSPDEEMAIQLRKMRAQLRAEAPSPAPLRTSKSKPKA